MHWDGMKLMLKLEWRVIGALVFRNGRRLRTGLEVMTVRVALV